MNKCDFFYSGRWSIQAIRSKADEIENFRSKLIFLKTTIRLIKKSKPKGKEALSTNAIITIKKIQRFIDQLENDFTNSKRNAQVDDRYKWTGNPEILIDLFFKLKNNVLGKEQRPLLDESNRRIAELIKNNFQIDLSVETIYDKLNPSKSHTKDLDTNSSDFEILIVKKRKLQRDS